MITGDEPMREVNDLHRLLEGMVLELCGISCRYAVAMVYYAAQRFRCLMK